MRKEFTDLMAVRLDACRFYAYHGVLPQERKAGNEFIVSVEAVYKPGGLNGCSSMDLYKNGSNPSADDKIEDEISSTISYADIYDIVKSEMGKPRNLLETVASGIAERVGELSDNLLSCRVEITKLTPPIAGIKGSATVELTRTFKLAPE